MLPWLLVFYAIGLLIGIWASLKADEESVFGGLPALLGIVLSIFWPLTLIGVIGLFFLDFVGVFPRE